MFTNSSSYPSLGLIVSPVESSQIRSGNEQQLFVDRGMSTMADDPKKDGPPAGLDHLPSFSDALKIGGIAALVSFVIPSGTDAKNSSMTTVAGKLLAGAQTGVAATSAEIANWGVMGLLPESLEDDAYKYSKFVAPGLAGSFQMGLNTFGPLKNPDDGPIRAFVKGAASDFVGRATLNYVMEKNY